MAELLVTERLLLRPWHMDDAQAALEVFGHAQLARWLSPGMEQVPDLTTMRSLLRQWIAEDARADPPAGRWCVQRREDERLIGGAILLPTPIEDGQLEMGWYLHPDVWGLGYASEATYTLASWAFDQGLDEFLALVRPENARAAVAVRRNGMEWVGETDKYFGMTMQVFRLRPGDLDRTARQTELPPNLNGER